jgi:2-polyprenyl-6-methoxyphenol hydroxylase-like FAD-dependent oxidoreductase
MHRSDWDVLVVGGGPAGLALALTLRHYSPLSVAVVERSSYDAPQIGETLSPGAQNLLEYLKVWDGFQADGHLRAYGNAATWGSPPGEWPPSCQAASSRADSEAVSDTGGAGTVVTNGPRLSHCWASQPLQS